MKLATTLFLFLLATNLLAQITTCDFSHKRISITINEGLSPGLLSIEYQNGPKVPEEITAKYTEEMNINNMLLDATVYETQKGTKVKLYEQYGESLGIYFGFVTNGLWPLSNCRTN